MYVCNDGYKYQIHYRPIGQSMPNCQGEIISIIPTTTISSNKTIEILELKLLEILKRENFSNDTLAYDHHWLVDTFIKTESVNL